jgi:hypothetical protein
MLLERDCSTRMDFSKVQYFEQLVFSRCLVICKVGGTENKPPLLPSLYGSIAQLFGHTLGINSTYLSAFPLLPQITCFDHSLIRRSSGLPPYVCALPPTLFIFVLFRFIATSRTSFSD